MDLSQMKVDTKALSLGFGVIVEPDSIAIGYYSGSGVVMRVDASGTRTWYHNGVVHRGGDLPAVEYADGSVVYVRHDKIHRGGDQPAIIKASGRREWWVAGKRHRSTKPAVMTAKGLAEWWQHGHLVKRIDVNDEVILRDRLAA